MYQPYNSSFVLKPTVDQVTLTHSLTHVGGKNMPRGDKSIHVEVKVCFLVVAETDTVL